MTESERTSLRLKLLEPERALNLWQRLQALPAKLVTGSVPPPMTVMSYRRDHFGKHFARFLQRAMRGSAHWHKS